VAVRAAGNGPGVGDEKIAERYDLEEVVGSGGMSAVYKARDTLLERNVALKILHQQFTDDEEYVARFRHEARTVAQLSHPNIVTVIDRGEDGGRQFIVFEYVDGENLKEFLERNGPLPVRRALELGIEIARGLAFAHQHGLVHRDVKPQNVLLNGEGKAKVTDFGIARSLDVERGMTQTGTVLGTSNYIAPEQASGQPVDAQTDIYALGVVLYELLTGEVPFPGENFVAVAMKHINESPPSLVEKRPDVPLRLAAAVDRALEKDPRDRFASMDDLADELEACLVELDDPDAEATLVALSQVVRAGGMRRARAPRSWWPVALALVGAAAVGAVVAGVLALGGSKERSPSGSGAGATPVVLHGTTDYDPQGTGGEHADTAALATDGGPGTYWKTQTYSTPEFGNLKSGLGLVLDAGRSVKLASITVTSDTPGFTAQILAGDSLSTRPAADSNTQTVGSTTTFTLHGATARYYVLWITRLPPGDAAHVNEVTAKR
jgi:tRNA A-37 threonylcarbamoyl transferase component Bud32